MRRIEVEPSAETDTHDIFVEGVHRFGIDQSNLYLEEINNQFELLAEHPRIGRPVASAKYPQALKFGLGSHIIIFTADDETLYIHRIFHARSNYTKHL